MRNVYRALALVAVLIIATAPLLAATATEFYTNLLRRGVAAYDAGRYEEASRQLRLAAFGFVDSIEQYETAHAYLAVAYDRLGSEERARDSARRVVAGEQVERRFATLLLPDAVRSAFQAVATRLLTPAEAAILRGTAPANVPQTASSNPAPRGTTGTTTAPRPALPEATNTNPPPVSTTPATPATTTPRETTITVPFDAPPAAERKPAVEPKPAPAKPPVTQPAVTQPAVTQPAVTQPAVTQPPVTQPAATQPKPAAPQPKPVPPAVPAFTASEIATRLSAAERALSTANLVEARRTYRELLAAPGLAHETLVRIAEGLYRSRDFTAVLQAFDRAGDLRRGEEPYRYYIAVASYETGQYARAKRELAAALPFIEITPDVARYRSKIEGAIN